LQGRTFSVLFNLVVLSGRNTIHIKSAGDTSGFDCYLDHPFVIHMGPWFRKTLEVHFFKIIGQMMRDS
jgi:hypothetical protein